jgi:hypothetical protein
VATSSSEKNIGIEITVLDVEADGKYKLSK